VTKVTDDKVDTPQRLEGLHNWRQRPLRDELFDCLLQPLDALLRNPYCIDHLLQRDLMNGAVELLFLEPS
jgi:hypothetical protein